MILKFIESYLPGRVPVDAAPPKMDDVWPIENVWSIIRTKLSKRDPPAKNLTELRTQIREIWQGIDVILCKKMMRSIPKKLAAVIKKKENGFENALMNKLSQYEII